MYITPLKTSPLVLGVQVGVESLLINIGEAPGFSAQHLPCETTTTTLQAL